MSTRIDVTFAATAYGGNNMAGIGSIRNPSGYVTGTDTNLVSTIACAAGASTTLWSRGTLPAPVLVSFIPSAAGTFSVLYDTDASSAPTWIHAPAQPGIPFTLPGGGFSNADPAAQAGDNAGVPTGLADAGRVDATIRTVLFTPASSVTSASTVQGAVFG